MSLSPLLGLLGLTFQLWPRAQTLNCQWGTYESVVKRSEQFLHWTAGEKHCSLASDGCLDTLLLIENGPLAKLVLIKDCTSGPDENVTITTHREEASLSFLSYKHVCRKDLCNDLASTLPLWGGVPSTAPAPGSMQCPFCLSPEGCLSPPMITCPVGTSHCYDGALWLSGAFISHRLRVQGCQSQAGCNLLNGTQEIGLLSLKESCQPSEFLTCHQGILLAQGRTLVPWLTNNSEICSKWQLCEETLLLIASGSKMFLIWKKGCSQPPPSHSQKTILVHSKSLGMLVASYSKFCNSSGCNNAKSSEVLLNGLPQHAPQDPGHIQCPICVNLSGSCPEKPKVVRCPKRSSHCYQGILKIQGGELDSKIDVRGCVDQSSTSLLNQSRLIGTIFVAEIETLIKAKATPVLSLAWVMASALATALWVGGFSSPW